MTVRGPIEPTQGHRFADNLEIFVAPIIRQSIRVAGRVFHVSSHYVIWQGNLRLNGGRVGEDDSCPVAQLPRRFSL